METANINRQPGYLDLDSFARAFVNGWIVDGRNGGLVVGRSHAEGHIVFLSPGEQLGHYEIQGVMEGGEYLMNPLATKKHWRRLNEINACRDAFASVLPLKARRIIHTHAEPHDKLVVVHEQFVVNARATSKYVDELDAMNEESSFHSGRIFSDAELSALHALRPG